MLHALALAAGLAALLVPLAAVAQKEPVGPPFRVNTTAYGYQGFPHGPDVAMDAVGNFVVVWEDSSINEGIFAQRFGSNGARVGAEFHVSVNPTYYGQSAVSMDAAGNFVVVWMEDYAYIRGRRFDSTGTSLGPPFLVNTITDYGPRNPKVAHDGSGNFVVVWGQFSNYPGIEGQRFDSNGTPVGGEFAVNSLVGGGAGYNGINEDDDGIEIAANAAGSFMVVWETYYHDGSGDGVFGRVFDSTGTPAGADFQVNVYTTNRQNYPGITVDGAGNFIVVWGSEEFPDRVVGRRFDGTGAPISGEFQANVAPSSYVMPKASADAAGNLTVVWAEDYEIRGRQLDATNTPLAGEFVTDTPSSYSPYGYNYFDDRLPDVASNAAGDFVVAWMSYGQFQYGSGSDFEVFAQRFAASPCSPAPDPTCRQPFVPRKGLLGIRDMANNKFDDLKWQWLRGEATANADFGNPFTTTSYGLCIYDASGAPQPILDARATAGGTCAGKPCWRTLAGGGYYYFDNNTNLEGLESIRLKPGADGVARIGVRVNGARLEPPVLPLTPPVTVQLQASNGECWGSSFDALITQNGNGRFRAKPGS